MQFSPKFSMGERERERYKFFCAPEKVPNLNSLLALLKVSDMYTVVVVWDGEFHLCPTPIFPSTS